MILQALNTYYQRLLARGEEGLAPFGYSPEKISYEILLAPDGSVADVKDIRDTSGKKPMPRLMNVPQPEKRTVGIKSNFLWDKTSYVLGVSATSKRCDKEHEAFKTLHQESLAGTDDAGLKALLAFLAAWTPERFAQPPFKEEMLDANMVFRMDGEKAYLHERTMAIAIWGQMLADREEGALIGVCLVTGKHATLARLHASIKGVTGTQTNGASIAAFNDDAYLSYFGSLTKAASSKKENNTGANAPVSVQAAFAYTTVLNHLLRRGEHNRQRIQIGDASVVFWAEAEDAQQAQEAELTFESLLEAPPDDSQEAARVRQVLEQVAKGRPLRELDPKLEDSTRMYVLGLAPNASRISIRFWETDTLAVFARRLAEHYDDLALEPMAWQRPPTLKLLALQIAPIYGENRKFKDEDVPPQLAGELTRAILTGIRYPRSMLAALVMRFRADGNITDLRVALCKAILTRDVRLKRSHIPSDISITPTQEAPPVSLDFNNTDPAYLLGRLFSTLDGVQYAALGKINAPICDRYYGAASATPAGIFPMLLRNARNHLSKLRKEKPGLAVNLEKDIIQIVDALMPTFPRSLGIDAQGRFAIGYYHQTKARFAGNDSQNPSNTNTDSKGDQE